MTAKTETANIVFFAAEPVEISGFDRECECSHCGRPLKIGVRLAGFSGTFGADCLAKAATSYLYLGRRYRQNADSIKERAIIRGKGAACMDRHGMSERNMRFVLKTALQSI
jgi:hypothetical protein